MIDEKELIVWIKERKQQSLEAHSISGIREILDGAYFRYAMDEVLGKIEELTNKPIITVYDREETHKNCTVQILSNSYTGDVSIGWWPETQEEIRTE